MKTYPTLKASGVDWIPEIPSHWDVRRTDNLFCHNKERNTTEEEHVVLSLSYGNIVRRNIETNFGLLPESFETYQVLNPGDIVLRLTDLQNDKRSLRVGLSKHRGIITSAYVGLRAKESTVYSPFFYRLLYTYDILKLFYTLGAGVRQSMRFEDVRRIPLLIPPLPEQKQIVSFLDSRNTLIDTIIENKTQRIELLKEMRSSLISEVVTKGTSPDVPMKDSGVECIGKIPSHWVVSKVKFFYSLTSGFPFDSETLTNEATQYPVIRIGNVTSGKIDIYYSGSMNDRIPTVDTGDYVVSLTGDFNIREWRQPPSLLNQRCGLVKVIGSHVPRYLFYVLPDQFTFLENTKYYTTLKNLSNGEFLNIHLLVPPIDEQERIVSFLDEKTALIDEEVSREESSIVYMNEFRQSLIHEVVTGKMDVRGVVTS